MAAITIIGTGRMAKGIATVALRGGYEVVFHSRDPETNGTEVKALTGASDENVSVVPHSSDIKTEMVILAIPYKSCEETAASYGDKLDGKVVVDISNPIDWTKLELLELPAGSVAQQIASVAPKARVIKGFNTINAELLESGKAGGLPLDVFIVGDDQAAKQQLIDLVDAGGLRGIDTGPLNHARELEILEHIFVNMKLTTNGIKAIKIVSD